MHWASRSLFCVVVVAWTAACGSSGQADRPSSGDAVADLAVADGQGTEGDGVQADAAAAPDTAAAPVPAADL